MAVKKKDPEVTVPELTSGPNAETLKAAGIPVARATFHRTISSIVDGTPEYQYYHPGGTNKKSRVAFMWYTTSGLLIQQDDLKKVTRHKLIPLANVSDTELL